LAGGEAKAPVGSGTAVAVSTTRSGVAVLHYTAVFRRQELSPLPLPMVVSTCSVVGSCCVFVRIVESVTAIMFGFTSQSLLGKCHHNNNSTQHNWY